MRLLNAVLKGNYLFNTVKNVLCCYKLCKIMFFICGY